MTSASTLSVHEPLKPNSRSQGALLDLLNPTSNSKPIGQSVRVTDMAFLAESNTLKPERLQGGASVLQGF